MWFRTNIKKEDWRWSGRVQDDDRKEERQVMCDGEKWLFLLEREMLTASFSYPEGEMHPLLHVCFLFSIQSPPRPEYLMNLGAVVWDGTCERDKHLSSLERRSNDRCILSRERVGTLSKMVRMINSDTHTWVHVSDGCLCFYVSFCTYPCASFSGRRRNLGEEVKKTLSSS